MRHMDINRTLVLIILHKQKKCKALAVLSDSHSKQYFEKKE